MLITSYNETTRQDYSLLVNSWSQSECLQMMMRRTLLCFVTLETVRIDPTQDILLELHVVEGFDLHFLFTTASHTGYCWLKCSKEKTCFLGLFIVKT